MIQIEEQFRISHISEKIFDRIFDQKFSFKGEAHDFWEIVCVVSGKIEIVENENVYIMSEGDIVFHAPMEFHKICATENTEPRVLNMSFIAQGNLPVRLKDGVFHLNTQQLHDYMKLLRFIKEQMVEPKQPDCFAGQEAASRLAAFIIWLCSDAQLREIYSKTTSALSYKFLVNLMKEEVDNNSSVAKLSEQSFISVSYIKFLFQHYAGISPKQYYNNLRIIRAKELLEQGLSVTETSNKMNFSSPNNFVRFFKTLTSVTPYQYKKKPD